jgi:hypothetical protein
MAFAVTGGAGRFWVITPIHKGRRPFIQPQLLFVLRGVDENELIAGAGQDLPLSRETPGAAKVLSDTDVAALF